MPEYARTMKVVPTEPGLDAAIAFSALPSDQAKAIEPAFAQAGHGVCSNASAYRMEADVPLLIPEVNPDHTALIKVQQQTARLERLHRDESQLHVHGFHDRLPAFAGYLRNQEGFRRVDAGVVGRGLSGRGLARCGG